MSEAVSKPLIEFGGRVPAAEYDRFRDSFPQYGATNWFINKSLRRFNEYVDEHPEVKEAIDRSIDQMLDETLRDTPRSEAA
jgi:hypothetical protein